MVSQYNVGSMDERYGVKNLVNVIPKRLKIQGFIQMDKDFAPKWTADHQKNVAKWLSEGSFQSKLSVTVGMDNAIKGFLGMLKGENFGKAVLQIDELKVSFESTGKA